MGYKVGVTGTQRGCSESQLDTLRRTLESLDISELHHGDCIGVDAEAHGIALELGIKIIVHPPTNMSKRAMCGGGLNLPPRPYIPRNHDIVDECSILIAVPKEVKEQLRSGTWATVRYARKLHRVILPILPWPGEE